MVRKKLAVAVAALGALQADLASALGMGELFMNSALNQPLDAEIRLLETRDLDESQLKISLAGREDFERAGVERAYFLTNLEFDVELNERGEGVIKVTTRDPVVEPYLNFLVEARWPSGRLLREYTVLLDLPAFSETEPGEVSTAATSGAAEPGPAPEAAATTAAVGSTSSRQTLSEGRLQPGEKYRVRQDETLWEIAAQSRPTRGVTVQQTMVSIQRLNPEAFIGGNINRLKAGYVLRLPTEAEVTDISGRDAIQEVAKQNRSWKTGDSAVANTGAAPLDATESASGSEDGYSEEARLSIATAGDSDTGASGEGSGAGTAALRDRLDASLEDLDKTKRENSELQGRLDDMESKIATLQRLLELKDDQLAALQGQAAGQQEATDTATPEPGAPESEAEPGMDQAEAPDTEQPAAQQEAMTPEQPSAEDEATPAPEPAQPAPARPAPETSLLDDILSNPLYLGGAGLLVLAIAAVLVIRRRQAAEEAEAEELSLFDQPEEPAWDTEVAEDVAEPESDEATDDAGDLLAAELEQEIAADNAAAGVEEDEETTPAAVQSETGDAIAEADIYIAYGRYQQAVDLLSTAIAQEPQRSDLRVKLLEVYLETRDKPDFQQQYVALQSLGDDVAIGEVKEMLSSVDGVADWLDDLPGAAETEVSDADMDAELIEGDSESGESELEDDLEIDLDFDDSLGSTQETEAVSLDDDLDLDLDLENEDETVADSATTVMDAVSEQPEMEEQPAEAESAADTTGEFDLELGDDLDFELGDLDAAPHDSGEEDSGETAQDTDFGDLDLGDFDQGETSETATPESTEPATEEGFDLDLDAESDLDMDLGDLGDSDLSDLEAEFGESETSSATEEPAPSRPTDLDVNLDTAESAGDDLDLDDLDLSSGETVSLDTGGQDLDLDLDDNFELPGELENPDQEAPSEVSGESPSEESFSLELEPEDDLQAPSTPATSEPSPTEATSDESFSSAGASEDEFDFLADTDEVATKLDLARAYIDMGDTEGAKDILDEVLQEGNDEQKQEANSLMERV